MKGVIFLCNGKAPCHLRADGKANEFCRREVNGIEGCYHTSDEKYALNSPENRVFDGNVERRNACG